MKISVLSLILEVFMSSFIGAGVFLCVFHGREGEASADDFSGIAVTGDNL